MPSLKYKLNDQEFTVVLKDRTRIGRAEDNEICIPLPSLSRHHAVVARDGVDFTIEDAGSSNGIVQEGEAVRFLMLTNGVTFSLGEVAFTFLVTDGAPPSPPPPTPLPTPPMAKETIAEPPPEPETPALTPVVEATPIVAAISDAVPLTPARSPSGGEGVPNAPPPVVGLAEDKKERATEAVRRLNEAHERIMAEIGKVIIGQREVLTEILVALFARGHCLLIGVPGLAKTLMVKALGSAVNLDTKRIQFTPDLMPSDITGTDILEEDPINGRREFRFHKGPIFTNLLLADEINRTPPKTQAALLEAMQERRVTASGQTFDLPDPFMVLATQNPIEQEGTYPLPEAQLDRFMFCVHLKYPSLADEQRVLLETTRDLEWDVEKVLDARTIIQCQHLVRQVPVSEHVALYAMNLIRATRPDTDGAPDFIKRWVRWGAGTRAGQYLLLAAKAHVLLQGRFSVSCADIRAHALPVLRHRIFCNFAAASEGVNTDDIVKKVVEAIKEPEYKIAEH